MIYLKFLFKFLPEFFDMLKAIVKLSQDGIEDAVIRRRFKKIGKSFKRKDRVKAAQELNDVFKKLH